MKDSIGSAYSLNCCSPDSSNTNSPFNLSIDQSRTFLVDCSALTQAGYYVLTLEIDPDNLIKEKYSSKDGSLRSDWDDNIEQITMQT